ncbi:MAG: MFS transporter [Proteobacteria bacterium]|nr:MFS transporter [Pseudomonadota bacterium]
MSVFGNSAVNRAILHTVIQQLAQQGGGVFVFIFLLKAGVPAPLVLCVVAAMVACRFVMRPAVLPLARRLGLRRTLMLGTVLEAAIFLMLPFVHGPGPLLFAVILVSAGGSVVYWTCYHAYFAAIGDEEHRGGQIGVREALSALAGVVAPALGGWGLAASGPGVSFGAAALVQAAAALPLVGAREVEIVHEVPGGFRAAWAGSMLMATDGWFAAAFHYTWQIALFLSLGERFANFGGAMALAGLAGAVGSVTVGRLIDLGRGRLSVLLAYGFGAGVMALRAVSFGHPAAAVAANAAGAITGALLIPTLMTRLYSLARRSPCPLRFNIAAEAGWDVGCGLGCLSAAGLLTQTGSLTPAILLGLAGAAAAATLLLRGYGGD